jgi:hypothetical protein
MDVKAVIPLNADGVIIFTEDGMVMDVKAVIPWNAAPPISVTLAGIVIEVTLDAPLNAPYPIIVYPEITTFDILLLAKLALATIVSVRLSVPINAL